MNNLRDLNIENELLPLFDYSLNSFSRQKIVEILNNPLDSIAAITHRQNIFKGFSSNNSVLKDYSYTVLYLNEVYFFLTQEDFENLFQKKRMFKLFDSKDEKRIYLGKLNQLILFFSRLESKYFSRIVVSGFPKKFSLIIKRILQFLSHFELSYFEYVIREKRLKNKDVISLTEKITHLKQKGLITLFWEDLFLFEAYLSINYGILKYNLIFPSFSEQTISLKNVYHPLITNPVKNNFESSSNVILLNGPNMSGKSTFLKAISLCFYLGHLGIGIPASAGIIPFCNHFSLKINSSDNLSIGYSHFMTEVINLKNVVEKAKSGKQCFAVFDELFSGTNAEDAFEICKTTINGLTKFKDSYFFISTHIQELKTASNPQVSSYFIDCEIIDSKPMFNYKLNKGWSDIKVGQILFDKVGLNELLS